MAGLVFSQGLAFVQPFVQGLGLTFALGMVGQFALGRILRLRSDASRREQLRYYMWLCLGRMGIDFLALLTVFFLLADVWALVGGALGLLGWRGVDVALGQVRNRVHCRSHGLSGGQDQGYGQAQGEPGKLPHGKEAVFRP